MRETFYGSAPDNNADDRPVYKPSLKFHTAGLWVTFDHELQATSDELETCTAKGVLTIFLISPDSELYYGLHFIPRPVLSELARGLKSCAASEEYTDAQRGEIQTSVTRLERFIATGER